MLRVLTHLTGTGVTGGGVNQLFFNNDPADSQLCADAVQTFWNTLSAQMSNLVNYEVDSEVAAITPQDGVVGAYHTVNTAPAASGDLTNTPIALSSQGLIQWRTSTVINSRRVQGRTFVPGMVEDNNFAPGVPGGSFPAAALAAGLALIAEVTPVLVIWHRPVGSSAGSVAPVVNAQVWNQWAVLRSRRD